MGLLFYLSQTRYFALDEYQYMTATTLSARGLVPYLDFYEYHTPLSYLLHAPFFISYWSDYSTLALFFRKIVFCYLLLGYGFTVYYFLKKGQEIGGSLLFAIIPFSISAGTLSLIEYRADNMMAVTLLMSFLLIDLNAEKNQKKLSLISGMLLGISILFTQKALLITGAVLFYLFCVDVLNQVKGKKSYVKFKKELLFGLMLPLISFLLYLFFTDSFAQFVQFVFIDSSRHEKYYPPVHFMSFLKNYITLTFPSLAFIVLLIFSYFAYCKERIFFLVFLMSTVSMIITKAQFPHNFVLPSLFLGFIVVNGFSEIMKVFPEESIWKRFLTGICALMLINQYLFLFGKSTNAHQLKLFSKLEKMSSHDDVYIDNAGGGVFLRPANFHYLHGAAHRVIYKDKFMNTFVNEYRDNAAKFLIKDSRYVPYVMDYIKNHFIQLDSSLMVYGKYMDFTRMDEYQIEVQKDGDYYFFVASD